MDIIVTLTDTEQTLLLVNEYNDGPDTQPDAWSTIARKVRAAQFIEPGTHCTCCLDNECECSGTAISGSAAPLGDAARAIYSAATAYEQGAERSAAERLYAEGVADLACYLAGGVPVANSRLRAMDGDGSLFPARV